MVYGPGGGAELWQSLDGCAGEPGQDGGEVVTHRDIELAQVSTMERIAATRGPAFSCPMWVQLRCLIAPDRHRAHRVFSEVVAQFQLGIVEQARELVPQAKGVGASLAERARWEWVEGGGGGAGGGAVLAALPGFVSSVAHAFDEDLIFNDRVDGNVGPRGKD